VGKDGIAMPQQALNPALLSRTDKVGLSERTAECLTGADILYIGDLVQMSEIELLGMAHVGRGTLKEIKVMLAGLGLHLGMVVPDWPAESLGR
jgi:DNA-directed RNA polymerase subunit alpha